MTGDMNPITTRLVVSNNAAIIVNICGVFIIIPALGQKF
jgi:hypothetical protein